MTINFNRIYINLFILNFTRKTKNYTRDITYKINDKLNARTNCLCTCRLKPMGPTENFHLQIIISDRSNNLLNSFAVDRPS